MEAKLTRWEVQDFNKLFPKIEKTIRQITYRIWERRTPTYSLDDVTEAVHWALVRNFRHYRKRQRTGKNANISGLIYWTKRRAKYVLDSSIRAKKRVVKFITGEHTHDLLKYNVRGRQLDIPTALANKELVDKLLRVLPPRFREVVTLRYLDGCSLEAVGECLGICRQRVNQILRLAMDRLRKEAKKFG